MLPRHRSWQDTAHAIPFGCSGRSQASLTAELIHEGFLQQNSLTDDAYCTLDKTYLIAKAIAITHELIQNKVTVGLEIDNLYKEPLIEEIKRLKEFDIQNIEDFIEHLPNKINKIRIK